jgi:hypothetical protein
MVAKAKKNEAVVESAPVTGPPTTPEIAPEPVVVVPEPEEDVVAAVLALQEQLKERRQAAIDVLLQQRNDIDNKLFLLGHNTASVIPVKNKPDGPAADAYCKYCNLAGHDARSHRSQSVKRAFTQDELAALK